MFIPVWDDVAGVWKNIDMSQLFAGIFSKPTTRTRYAIIVENADYDPADGTSALFLASEATTSTGNTIESPAYSGSTDFLTLIFASPVRLKGAKQVGGFDAPIIPAAGDADVTLQITTGARHFIYAVPMNRLTAGSAWELFPAA